MAENDLSNTEKQLIADGFAATAKDLVSYKAAIDRLAENQQADHTRLLELGEMVNENFERLAKLVGTWCCHRRR